MREQYITIDMSHWLTVVIRFNTPTTNFFTSHPLRLFLYLSSTEEPHKLLTGFNLYD